MKKKKVGVPAFIAYAAIVLATAALLLIAGKGVDSRGKSEAAAIKLSQAGYSSAFFAPTYQGDGDYFVTARLGTVVDQRFTAADMCRKIPEAKAVTLTFGPESGSIESVCRS